MNMFNFGGTQHNFNKIDAVIEALQSSGYQVRMEREGNSHKKHQLLGVGLLYIDSACQYVIPCFNDLEFEMNPIILREGKLIVLQKVVGKASSLGHQWFESWVIEGNGQFSMFMTTQDKIDELVRTPPPMPVPEVEVVPRDQAATAASEAAAAVQQTPATGTQPAASA